MRADSVSGGRLLMAMATEQINERATSALDGLRCCCLLALADALHKGQVEHRAGQSFTSPCCSNRLIHREGAWEQDLEARA
jgi:hypothetical protein